MKCPLSKLLRLCGELRLTSNFVIQLCSAGGQLSEHQGLAGPDMPDCCRHDQGKDSRGNQEDL